MSVVEKKRISQRRHRFQTASARREKALESLSLPPYFRWKAILDRVLAVLLMTPGLPLIALLVLLVRLTSRGPGIYRQVRVGRDGRKFNINKIRTMRWDAEASSGPVWAQTAHDPRITLSGRVLRKFHLDELPQLLNVVKGEMSLVGPRPERPEFVHVLAESIPGYLDRLVAPSGITGLAQLNLPPDSDLNSVRHKLALDRDYIRHANAWLDVRIILCTGLRMTKLPERWLLLLFGLRRNVVLPAIPDFTPHVGGANGNGNGNGNGSDHSPASPSDILHQAASESSDGNGRHGRQGKDANVRHIIINKPR